MHRATLEGFQDELEKISALLGAPLGVVGHFGTNIAGRAAHRGSNLAEVMAHRGFQHGAGGARMSPGASKAMKLLLGPETAVQYEAARRAGSQLYDMPPEARAAALKGLGSVTEAGEAVGALSPAGRKALEEAPLVGPLQRAVQHDIAGTAPELKAKGPLAGAYAKAVDWMSRRAETPFQTPTQRVATNVAGAAPAAALAAVDPVGAGVHMGWNLTREQIGKSELGQKGLKALFRKGLAGEKPSKAVETAVDIAGSPALLDPLRIGLAAREAGAVKPMKAAVRALEGPTAREALEAAGETSPEVATKARGVLSELKGLVPARGS